MKTPKTEQEFIAWERDSLVTIAKSKADLLQKMDQKVLLVMSTSAPPGPLVEEYLAAKELAAAARGTENRDAAELRWWDAGQAILNRRG